MSTLDAFPVTARWRPSHPDRLQLYSFPTPNGVKISIMLEEIGLPYEAHLVDIQANQTRSEDFLSLNPNGKIPAIIDPDGLAGRPVALFESGAILLYLAEKTGRLLPTDAEARLETIQWVFFQMASVGPMFGQLGFFHKFAGREIDDKRPRDRYRDETARLLRVLERRLEAREWMVANDYTIADVALIGWVRAINVVYEAGELVGWNEFPQVQAWLDRMLARPAVERGLAIPKRPG